MPGVAEPRANFADFVEPIAIALEQEQKVTGQISELAAIAREERDFVSEQFVQWFLKEQVEEVDLVSRCSRSPSAPRAAARHRGVHRPRGHRRRRGYDSSAPAPAGAELELHELAPGGESPTRWPPGGGLPLGGAALARPRPLRRAPARRRPGDLVADALASAAARGVAVRLAYNADHDERPGAAAAADRPDLIEALAFPPPASPGSPT